MAKCKIWAKTKSNLIYLEVKIKFPSFLGTVDHRLTDNEGRELVVTNPDKNTFSRTVFNTD
jgi:hypothetical protein